MGRAQCRRFLMTLAAAAAMGLLAAGTLPAQAQASATASSADLLATLGARRVAPYLSCCQLGEYRVYMLAEPATSQPAAVIFEHTQPQGRQAAEAASIAERFQRVYALRGYRLVTARSGCAAFLFREGRYHPGKRYYEKDIFWLLKAEERLAGTLDWLNDRCGGSPHRLEGTRLVWRGEVDVRGNKRPYEVFLPLLGGAPRLVDVRLGQVPASAVRELMAKKLSLPLRQVKGITGSSLRRKAGTKVLGYMGGTDLDAGAVLVRLSTDGGFYRLALLATMREHEQAETGELPELPHARWADEQKAESEPTATATPRPDEAAPESSSAPVSPPANTATMPTPAEARKAYAERLRAL